MPWGVVVLAAAITSLGLVAIARGQELAEARERFLSQQLIWCGVAAGAMVVAAVPNFRRLARFATLAYFFVLALLLAVYFFPPVNGAHRWIKFAGLTLQPSEFAKLATIASLAAWARYREPVIGLKGLAAPLALAALPCLLILREPNLGSALVFPPVALAMLFAAGARAIDLAKVAAIGIVLAPLMWTQMSREQRSRIVALGRQNPPEVSPTADGYQLHQAKQVLALGGVWGSYLGREPTDDAWAYRLPEDHTDFVFSIVGERFGWFGMAILLNLYTALVAEIVRVATRTCEPFGRLLTFGVAAMFAAQATINTGMTVGLLPITGVGLPLVSYGGSSLVAHAVALGLVVNVGLRPGYEVIDFQVWRSDRKSEVSTRHSCFVETGRLEAEETAAR